MNIEVKDIKYNSEQGTLLAVLYVDGEKTADIETLLFHKGLNNTYYPYGADGHDRLELARDFCETLPPWEVPSEGGKEEVLMDLEVFIRKAVFEHARLEADKEYDVQMQRAMQTGIIWGTKDSYNTLELPATVDIILAHSSTASILKDKIRQIVLPQLKEGEKILNTNLPAEFLKDLNETSKKEHKRGQHDSEDENEGRSAERRKKR